ncbi:hypothetical protein BT69DRAFT_1319304 [Atractiella rhizophila]|nr:hypothetical protein BT69DRAFT_1319304 [Atractiella rhizophila]
MSTASSSLTHSRNHSGSVTPSNGSPSGSFSLPDSPFSDLSLVDLLVSFDATIELLSRAIRQQGKRVERGMEKRRRALEELLKREGWGEAEREVERLKLRVEERMKALSLKWNETKIVSLREQISFFFGVNNIVATVLLLGFYPTYIPLFYTIQALILLPWRLYTYKKKAWHYFLFDLCYYINGLLLLWLWVFPSSSLLFAAVWGLANGPLATAVLTWRNSLVFHSIDKVTSLYIHLYPPLVLMTIKHFYPPGLAEARYPALKGGWLGWKSFLAVTSVVCASVLVSCHFQERKKLRSDVADIIWQGGYWYFVIEKRREKIAKGRITSFTYLLNDKKGTIGKMLTYIPGAYKELSFMVGQMIYTILTVSPSILYFNHKTADAIFVASMFSVAVWNGASFYVEVWGRRFEKELIALRKEFESLSAERNHSKDEGEKGCSTPVVGGGEVVQSPAEERTEEEVVPKEEKAEDGGILPKMPSDAREAPKSVGEGEEVELPEDKEHVLPTYPDLPEATPTQEKEESEVSSDKLAMRPIEMIGESSDSVKLPTANTALDEKVKRDYAEKKDGDVTAVGMEKMQSWEKEGLSDFETTSQASHTSSSRSWEDMGRASPGED